jgi:para-nitrobenzyl esterase
MIDRRGLLRATTAGCLGSTLISGIPSAGAASSAAPIHSNSDVARTEHGSVKGTRADGVTTFKGIPYGASTAGTARFRPPMPPQPWHEILETTEFGPMCPQLTSPLPSIFSSWTFDKDMSEDCLKLNVWTPALRDNRKRPVMVWFHGGDFANLSGSRNVFDGTRLCQKGDVVVVTVNHRLNLFGYLYLGELTQSLPDSGNAGMLDLVAALRWVRTNIAEFGGDPGNVTIFGQSGGGAKVSTIMAMPAARGLYHRAIVESGSYYLEAMDKDAGTKKALALLKALDMDPKDAAKLVDLPMQALLAGFAKASKTPDKPNYRPVVDGHSLPSGPWFPGGPALSANVPMMIGTMATETTLLVGAGDPSTFSLDDATMRTRLASWVPAADVDKVVAEFRVKHPDATPSDLFFAISTDRLMRQGAWQQAERKVAQHSAPVYLYELDWRTPVEGGKWHTPHSLELAFVFDNVAKSAAIVGTGPEPQKLADQMSGAWLAFAHTGNPNNAAIPHWPHYALNDRPTMVFDVQSQVVSDYRGDERVALADLPNRTS